MVPPQFDVVATLGAGFPPPPAGYTRQEALHDATLAAVMVWNEAMGLDGLVFGGRYVAGADSSQLDVIVVQFPDAEAEWSFDGEHYSCGGRWYFASPQLLSTSPKQWIIKLCMDLDDFQLGYGTPEQGRLIAHELGHVAGMRDVYEATPEGYCGLMGPGCFPLAVNPTEAAVGRAAFAGE